MALTSLILGALSTAMILAILFATSFIPATFSAFVYIGSVLFIVGLPLGLAAAIGRKGKSKKTVFVAIGLNATALLFAVIYFATLITSL